MILVENEHLGAYGMDLVKIVQELMKMNTEKL